MVEPISPFMTSPSSDARSARMLTALERVSTFIASVVDLEELLRRVMRESEELLEAEASAVFLYDDINDELYFKVVLAAPEIAEKLKNLRIKVTGGRGFAAECAETRQPINCQDCQDDPRHNKQADKASGFITRALLAVPMIWKDKLIGVLEVLNRRGGGYFDNEDLRIMELIARQAAMAIENARLIEANIQAERLGAMGTGVAAAAHSIKNTLTIIRSSMSLINSSLQSEPPDMATLMQLWPMLQRNENTLSSLVQDMLLFSKQREPELEDGSIISLCERIADLAEQKATEVALDLKRSWPEGDPLETAFEEKGLYDVIVNLVGNAIDATAGKGSFVQLSAARSEDERSIMIRVTDDGSGIAEEHLKRIWEPFFSTKGKRGTGLGLAMVRKSIEEHQGQITVASKLGEGTTFTIVLPIRQAPPKDENARDVLIIDGELG